MNAAVNNLIGQARESESLRRRNALLVAENMRLRAENDRLKRDMEETLSVGLLITTNQGCKCRSQYL